MLIQPGKVYIHAEGGRYRVLRLGFKMRCPVSGEWLKAVMYEPSDYGPDKNFGNGDVYVRSQKDFCQRFELEDSP